MPCWYVKQLTGTIKSDGKTATGSFRCGSHRHTLTITMNGSSVRIVEKGPCKEKLLGNEPKTTKKAVTRTFY